MGPTNNHFSSNLLKEQNSQKNSEFMLNYSCNVGQLKFELMLIYKNSNGQLKKCLFLVAAAILNVLKGIYPMTIPAWFGSVAKFQMH